jgi:hypothetical protein
MANDDRIDLSALHPDASIPDDPAPEGSDWPSWLQRDRPGVDKSIDLPAFGADVPLPSWLEPYLAPTTQAPIAAQPGKLPSWLEPLLPLVGQAPIFVRPRK